MGYCKDTGVDSCSDEIGAGPANARAVFSGDTSGTLSGMVMSQRS